MLGIYKMFCPPIRNLHADKCGKSRPHQRIEIALQSRYIPYEV